MILKKQWKENNNDSDLCYNDFVLSIKRIDNWSIYYGKEINKVVMGELIDKSAVVAEIEKRVTEGEKVSKEVPSSAIMGLVQAYKNTLSFIDTLEVKEVDCEREIGMYTTKELLRKRNKATNVFHLTQGDIDRIAEHFFELGLKVAQK